MSLLLRRRGLLQRAGGSPVPPTLSGTVRAWFDVSQLDGFSDEDLVSTLPDLSGNGRHATAAGAQRPVYKVNIQNGLPGLRFGSPRRMSTPSFSRGSSVMVVDCVAYNSNQYLTALGENSDNDKHVRRNLSTNFLRNGVGQSHWVDGVATTSLGSSTFPAKVISTNMSTTDTDVVTLMDTSSSGGRPWDGHVFEVWIMSAGFVGSDRTLLQDYLMEKWSVL